MRAGLLIAMVLLLPGISLGQNQKELDSLQALLPQVKDTAQVNVLYAIARYEFDRDPEKAMQLSKESLQKAKVLEFVNGEVMAYKQIGSFYNLYKSDFTAARQYLDSAEALAQTSPQKVSIYTALGAVCSRMGEFERGQTYLLKALDLITDKLSRPAFHTYSYIAYNLSLRGLHREAVQYYKKCVFIADHNKNNRDIGLALSNLGLSYMNLEEYDSAFMIHKRLYAFELEHGNPLMNATLLSELGKLYFEKGKVDSAYYFMHTGLKAAYKLNMAYAITRSLSNLGRYHLKNNPDSALYYGWKLHHQNKQMAALELEDVSYILAKAHGKRQRYDSAFYYFNQYSVYHDSVFQEKQARQIAELETRYKLKSKQEEIQRLEAARQNEVLKRNAFAGGLVLTVSIGVLIFFVLRARIRARKKEIELKNIQLENFTRKMVEKSELVEELRAQLDQFKSEIVIPRERIENVSQILNSSILTEDDWEEFKSLFNQVNPSFFAELKLKHPSLTQAEIRLAALIKLNLSTKEMANMLGISADSANKARYRLRKKLYLLPEQELKDVIENVSIP
jgi:tetratricopeptide (TPR) repeat protein